jgi:hypothetical protein
VAGLPVRALFAGVLRGISTRGHDSFLVTIAAEGFAERGAFYGLRTDANRQYTLFERKL